MAHQLNTRLTKNTFVHRCVCFGFLSLLLIPFVIGILKFGGNTPRLDRENRNKEAWPENTLLTSNFTRYTAQVNRFMSDHIGLRESLLRLHAKFQYRILNKTVSNKAVIAENGWLFYAEHNVLKNASESPFFGEQEAIAWLTPMLDYQRLIELNGGKLIVVLVPEKHHVYSEHLPNGYRYTRENRRADIIEQASNASGITVINLLDAMLAEKEVGKLYLKSDSHWTQRGAYVGYRELVKELQKENPNIPFNPWSTLKKIDPIRESGDLAALLNLSDEFEEDDERHIPVHKQPGVVIETANHPSLLLVGDSFSSRLHDFLPSSFIGTLFVHHHFRSLPTAVVAKRTPDIVVVEIIERALGKPFIISEHE